MQSHSFPLFTLKADCIKCQKEQDEQCEQDIALEMEQWAERVALVRVAHSAPFSDSSVTSTLPHCTERLHDVTPEMERN